MEYVIFEQIKKRVKEKLKWINDVMQYEQNDVLQQGSLPFKPPVLFISFENINQMNFIGKVQRTFVDVVVRFVFEEYTTDYLKGMKHKNDVAYCLNLFGSGWGGSALVQVQNEADERADELYVYKLRFKCSYLTDYSNVKPIGGTNGALNINIKLSELTGSGTAGFAKDGVII